MGPHRHFLIVEDDEFLRRSLAAQLVDLMGCSVTAVGLAMEALTAVRTGPRVDAILIDAGLPDGDGRDLCRRLRHDGVVVPIVIVSGDTHEAEVVRGLDAGANDYVAKPFRAAELAARLRAQIRAFEASESAEIAVGDYIFRPGFKELRAPDNARPVRLTEKEVALLKFLYRAGGVPVSRQTLLREVWGYRASSTTHTVETHIYRLRRKIEPFPDGRPLVLNDGSGYRLNLEGPAAAPASHRVHWPVPQLAAAG